MTTLVPHSATDTFLTPHSSGGTSLFPTSPSNIGDQPWWDGRRWLFRSLTGVSRTISSAPVSNGTNNRELILPAPADFSQVFTAGYIKLTGASTLGTPATGYQYSYETIPHFTIFDTTNSGHNQSLSRANGRTGAVANRTMVYHGGQGDAVAYNAYVELYSTPQVGSTHWLANAAGVILNGDNGIAAGSHQYMNSVELNHTDNGFDSAAIGIVLNFNRTNSTASQGEVWMGVRLQSTGTQPIDVGFSVTGKANRVLDTTQVTFDANNAALTLGGGHRIYLNSTYSALNGVNWYSTTPGSTYIHYSAGSSALQLIVDGTNAMQFGAVQNISVSDLVIFDGKNIEFGTTTGGKIGAGSTQKMGFWGATPVVRPTVTGSKGANAALASLMTTLANIGLVVDSTT